MIRIEDSTAEGGGRLRLIRLERPEKANALTAAMLTQIAEAVDEASATACDALILTGAGQVFSAGADLEAVVAQGLGTDPAWERASGAIAAFPGLSIAALNGTLAGGAFGMALACDLRIAVSAAKFFYPVMRLGHLPQPSDPQRMVALIGPARAKMILMAGRKIEAEAALAWGLIDRIVAPDALLEAAQALAKDVLAAKAGHAAAIKAMLQ